MDFDDYSDEKDKAEPEGQNGKRSLQSRFGKILHISTRKGQGGHGSELGSRRGSAASTASSCLPGEPRRKGIKSITSFAETYEMGKEVMPSTHSYMKVNFATRRSDGQEVVVKVRFKPNCFKSREDERTWRQNTEFLMNMPENCGVAKVHETLEDSKAFYVVMEKVEGLDLFEVLGQDGKVPVPTAKDILRQLLASCVHLHTHNAVHKDLKLENVMLNPQSPTSPKSAKSAPSGMIKVIDFDTLEEWTPASPTARDVVGTDQYIAQEAYGGKYSPLSDIFAVGVIAYRLLVGKFPFRDKMFDDEAGENWVGSPKMTQIRRRLKVAKVDTSHKVFQEHPQACDIVTRMLSYNEAARPTASAALEHPWFLEEDEPGGSAVGFSAGDVRCWEEEDLLDDGIIIPQGSSFY